MPVMKRTVLFGGNVSSQVLSERPSVPGSNTFSLSSEVLEEALVGSDPEGPLCELLFFFLSAIFQALDEEQEEVAKEQAEGHNLTNTHTHI